MRTASSLCLGIALMVGGLGDSSAEAGSGRYGSIVFRNPTSNTLKFQYRMRNDGVWQEYHVPPVTNFALYFELDHNGRAYTPDIRVDYFCGDGKCATFKYYRLKFYEAYGDDWHAGKPYKFEYDSSGNYLDLYKADWATRGAVSWPTM